MRLHEKRTKTTRIHGGALRFKSSSISSAGVKELTNMMNKLYTSEKPKFGKKLSSKFRL